MKRFAAALAVLAIAEGGCGTDHSLLAAHHDEPAGGVDAAVESAALDASDDRNEDDVLALDGGSDAGANPDASGPAEPPGTRAITVLDGIADAEAVRLCFVRTNGGVEVTDDAAPLPAGDAVLQFGERVSVIDLPRVDGGADDVHPYLVAGDRTAITAKDCAALLTTQAPADAGAEEGDDGSRDADIEGGDATDVTDDVPPPPRVRVISLPVIPAGTLADGRSYLLVVSGCVGGIGHETAAQEAICGAGYSDESPTATLGVVALSRITKTGALGLQVLHASPPTPDVRIRVAPSGGLVSWDVVILTAGGLGPRPPLESHDVASLGLKPLEALIDVQTLTPTSKDAAVPLEKALSLSGMTLSDIVDGRNYTLVLLGAAPGVIVGTFGQSFSVAIVPNDPSL